MDSRRLYLVLLMLVMVCQQADPAQNKPPAQGNGTPAKAELDPQLKVNRDLLLKTGDIDAAGLMLFDDDPNAREILLDVLKQGENSPARKAVCRVLIKAKADKQDVKDADVFIGPLLDVFDTEVADEVQLAAEATLIFEYEQIREPLERFVTDASKPAGARVNAIHALKLRRDNKRAAIKLIELLDDRDKRVSSEAAVALDSLGIVPGDTKEARQDTIKQIEDQALEVFLASRISSLEQQKRAMKAQLDQLVKEHLSLLNNTYKSLTEDDVKARFLAEYLASTRAPVKLWALEEASQWYKGTRRQFPRELFEPILIGSISDPHKEVRLRTADVLASMDELNSARPLLAQLEIEQDYQVKTRLFVALGWACSSAVSSSTPPKLTPELKEIRTHTLEWAEKFLCDENSVERAQYGAQVIERLLKRDGLEDTEEKKYLDLLLTRYDQLKDNPGGTLRGELLGAMAGLCAETSACRGVAVERYRSRFLDALKDGSNSVRETAVDGLANIDKADALTVLRNNSFFNDPSLEIRKKIIAMAGVVRVKADLKWLVDKIGVNSESDPAWEAMMGTFSGLGVDSLNEWVEKLTAETSTIKLVDDRKLAFLKIVESKAGSGKNPQMLKLVRERLATIYGRNSQFDRAEEYWKKLLASAKTPGEKDSIVVQLIDIYLAWPKLELATTLLADVLNRQDLDRGGALLKSVDGHLDEPRNGLDPKVVIAKLTAIKRPNGRPEWDQWLKDWESKLKKEDKPAPKPKPPA